MLKPFFDVRLCRAPDSEGATGGGELTMDTAVSALVEPDPAPNGETDEDSPAAPPAEESAPPEEAASADQEDAPQPEPEAEPPPAIEAPASWPDAEKARFAQLPPETQTYLAKRESDRDAFVQRKATEADQAAQAAQQERTTYADLVGRGEMLLRQVIQGEFAEVDWNRLSQEDPARYVQMQHAYRQRMQQLDAVVQERRQLDEKRNQEAQGTIGRALQEQSELLAKADPVFADAKTAASERQAICTWLTGLGAHASSLNLILDHALVVGLRKGMLYDRAQKAASEKKTQPVPPVQRPGTAPSKADRTAASRDAQMKRLERSGDIRDAVSLLFDP